MKTSYKIVTLGSSGAGKTSIIQRYINDSYSDLQVSTIGAAFQIKQLKYPDGSKLQLHIWDLAGQVRFNSIAPIYYRAADCCLIVYDLCDRESYDRAKYWVSTLLETNMTKMIIALVGNKVDLESSRTIQKAEAVEYASSQKLLYAEVSARTGAGLEDLFHLIVKALTSNPDLVEDTQIIKLRSDNQSNNARSSCWSSRFLHLSRPRIPFISR